MDEGKENMLVMLKGLMSVTKKVDGTEQKLDLKLVYMSDMMMVHMTGWKLVGEWGLKKDVWLGNLLEL